MGKKSQLTNMLAIGTIPVNRLVVIIQAKTKFLFLSAVSLRNIVQYCNNLNKKSNYLFAHWTGWRWLGNEWPGTWPLVPGVLWTLSANIFSGSSWGCLFKTIYVWQLNNAEGQSSSGCIVLNNLVFCVLGIEGLVLLKKQKSWFWMIARIVGDTHTDFLQYRDCMIKS